MLERVLLELGKHVAEGARTAWIDLEAAIPRIASELQLEAEDVKRYIIEAAYRDQPHLALYRSDQFNPEVIVVGGISYGYARLLS